MKKSSWKTSRIEVAIFIILFATYGYFHQGGGWSHNSRFAQVRSIVEEGKFEINNYVVYRSVEDIEGQTRLRRLPVQKGIQSEELAFTGNTGDISLFEERFYPNKPPGVVFAALPVYFVLYHFEHALGIDPDGWWPLTFNAYLTRTFSVSLLAALGGMVFYRISLRLFPSVPAWSHAASTMTFGLGTLMLPFATMLFDHDIVAALSLCGFLILLIERDAGCTLAQSAIALAAAGLVTGVSLLMGYSSVISVSLLAFCALTVARPRWKAVFFLLGSLLPVILLAWYHLLCFGSVWATANTYQYGFFQDKEMLLFGMFGPLRLGAMVKLLFSGYRGLFYTSPVLALAFVGFWLMARGTNRHAELWLCVTMFVCFLLANSSYNNWDGGWTIGPRYLIPALPFLSLPLALLFEKFPRATSAVAGLSVTIMLLATVVDPQPTWMIQNPLTQYTLPLLRGATMTLGKIDGSPLSPLIQGPVSANPVGVYESWVYPVSGPGTIQQQWHSFNLGEFIWPGSLMSLVPLLTLWALGVVMLWRWSRRSVVV